MKIRKMTTLIAVLLCISVLLTACGGGGGISGTYKDDDNGTWQMTFNSNGTCDIAFSGVKMSMDYTVDGNEISFSEPDSMDGMYGRTYTYFEDGGVINDDGTIKLNTQSAIFIKE